MKVKKALVLKGQYPFIYKGVPLLSPI